MNNLIAVPPDYDQLYPFFNVIRRVRSEVTPGIPQVVTIKIFFGADNRIIWTPPIVEQFEPRARRVVTIET